MFGTKSDKCQSCGAKQPEDARFCPECGAPSAATFRRCPTAGCDGIASPTESFCLRCGAGLPPIEREMKFDVFWNPPAGQVARRTEIDTEGQAVSGRVTVRFGHQALLLGDGGLTKALIPGSHELKTTMRDLQTGAEGPRRIGVAWFDTTPRRLEFAFDGLPLADDLPCEVRLGVTLALRHPERAFTALLGNATAIADEDIAARLRGPLENAVEEVVGQWLSSGVTPTAEQKEAVATRVRTHLAGVLADLGLDLLRVETLSLVVPDREKVRAERRQRLIRELHEEEGISTLTMEADWSRRRAEALERLRDHVNNAEQREIADKLAMKDFLRRVTTQDREQDILTEKQLTGLERAWELEKEDTERARRHVVARIDLEQQFELDRMRYMEEASRRNLKLEDAIAEDRKRKEGSRGEEWAAATHDDRLTSLQEEGQIRLMRVNVQVGKSEIELERERLGLEKDRMVLDHERQTMAFALDKEKMRLAHELDTEKTRLQQEFQLKETEARSRAYAENKKAQAAGKVDLLSAGRGQDPLAILALLGGGDAGAHEVLKEAYSSKKAEEKVELYKGFQSQLIALQQAVQEKNWKFLEQSLSQTFASLGMAFGAKQAQAEHAAATWQEAARAERERSPGPKTCPDCGTVYLIDPCPRCASKS